MRDKWTEISSEAYDHTNFMMPILGGALIRHVEKSEDGDVAVSVCFVPNADGKTALQSSQFEQLTVADPLLRSACVRAISLPPTHDRGPDGMSRPELRSL